MQKTVILKIGGSVLTRKDRNKPSFRKQLVSSCIIHLKKALSKNPSLRIILIHGAGSFGHQIAHKHQLKNGIKNDNTKLHASLKIRLANQSLNHKLFSLFLQNNLPVIPLHPGSLLQCENGTIRSFFFDSFESTFKNNCIPLIYGEMVFDNKLGMSVCSGDLLAFILAKKYNASRILFASDVDGIFSCDPYKNKNAQLFHTTNLSSLILDKNILLTGSHNIDVTGGLSNKIHMLKSHISSSLEDIIIFNGFIPENFGKIFDTTPSGTKILCQK